MADPMNRHIADRLEEAAHLLHDQGADRFRVNAYLRAARTVRYWPEPLGQVFHARGIEGVEELPGVGPSIARAIRELITHGRLPMLDRLRGASDPVTILASVTGIGRRLAEQLPDELGIATLEDLEAAAHDGRLATIADSATSGSPAAGIRSRIVWAASGHARTRRTPSPRWRSSWTSISVITAGRGPMRGSGVVAGRERECAALAGPAAA
jgi:hypothetical protein